MATKYSREALAAPNELLSALRDLFPGFGEEELIEDVRLGDATLHTVMSEFCSSFHAPAATSFQLNGLASLVGQCVADTDNLENAVGTCFLEHLRQIDRGRVFWKCLPPAVKDYIRTD